MTSPFEMLLMFLAAGFLKVVPAFLCAGLIIASPFVVYSQLRKRTDLDKWFLAVTGALVFFLNFYIIVGLWPDAIVPFVILATPIIIISEAF